MTCLMPDVFGYFVFWTLVFAFEFLNYLKTDFDWDFMSNVSPASAMHTAAVVSLPLALHRVCLCFEDMI